MAGKICVLGLALLEGGLGQAGLALPAIVYSGEIQTGRQAAPGLKAVICSKAHFGEIGPDCHLDEVRVRGEWAWVMWSGGEAGGTSLLRRVGKAWKHIEGGGGVMIVANAIEAGVPRETAEFLIPVADYEAPADLSYLSAWELQVIRNRVYARHGRRFTNARLQRYFESWPWYKPRKDYSDRLLSAADLRLVEAVRRVEKAKGYL